MVARADDLKRQIEHATVALAEARAGRQIRCESCKKKHRIRELSLVVTHWYTEPHGCTEGDYWTEGEWMFICLRTGVANRLLFTDKWDDVPAVEAEFKRLHRGLFKSKVDTYRDKPASWVNNYYVDQHRKLFELPPKTPEKDKHE